MSSWLYQTWFAPEVWQSFPLEIHQHRGGGITERRLVRHEYGWLQWNGNNIRDSVAILYPTVLDGFTAVNRRFRSNFNFFRFGSHRKLLSVIEKMSLIGMFQHPQDLLGSDTTPKNISAFVVRSRIRKINGRSNSK